MTRTRAADDFATIRVRMEELRPVTRPRAADDFATIRERVEELRRERAQVLADKHRGSVSGPRPYSVSSRPAPAGQRGFRPLFAGEDRVIGRRRVPLKAGPVRRGNVKHGAPRGKKINGRDSMLRTARTLDANGHKYLTPQAGHRIDPAAAEALLRKRGTIQIVHRRAGRLRDVDPRFHKLESASHAGLPALEPRNRALGASTLKAAGQQ